MTDMFGPDDPEEPPGGSWWDESFTVYGGHGTTFEDYTMTGAEWFNEVVMYDQDELLEMYGVDNLDILRQLEQRSDFGDELAFYYDDEGELHEYSVDWAFWREEYGGVE